MSRRLGIIIAVFGVIIALAGFLIISNLLRRAATPPVQATIPAPITETVVVTTHDVPLRAVLKLEDLTTMDIPVQLVPAHALSNLENAVGRITKIALVSGEMIMDHHLADPTNRNQDLAFVIEDDQVLMAIPATDLMSEIDVLQPGDVVDLLASIQQPILEGQAGLLDTQTDETQKEDMLFTFNALQRLQISAIVVEIVQARTAASSSATGFGQASADAETTPTPTPTPSPSEITPRAILIALAPQDALVVKHLIDAGGMLDFVLRAPTSNLEFDLQPVNSEYLEDRYELIITR